MLKKDKPLYFFLLWVFVIVLIRLVGSFTSFADDIFPYINESVSLILINVSSIFSFSIGDLIYLGLGLLLAYFLVKVFLAIRKKNWLNLKHLISNFFLGLIVFTVIFHFFWAFNYYKTPIKESYNTEEIEHNELKILAEFYLKKSIQLREITTENEDGIFENRLDKKSLQEEILNSAIELEKIKELKLNPVKPNLKNSIYSSAFSYMGVLGYYNPFTSEAQYNSKMPDTKLLFTQFHEVAHQWSFAPESEANFVGFLIGLNSKSPEFKYVSNYKALRSLLNKIVWEDPAYVEKMLDRYSFKMKTDRAYELEIQEKYLHSADDAFSMLNEAYLQLNNQDGLESYGQFVELLVGYHRKYNLPTGL